MTNQNGIDDFNGSNTGDSFVILFVTGAPSIPQGRWFTQGINGNSIIHVVGNRTGLTSAKFSSSNGGGLLSALRFPELTTENPSNVYVMLPVGVQRPRMSNPRLEAFWASPNAYRAGIEEHLISGVKVRITSPAKTVVDCFKYRSKVGINVAVEALRDAWRKKKASADDLCKIARLCRMTNIMRPYFESIVA